MDSIVEVLNLFKTYKLGLVDVEVLKDVNLTIDKGEFVTIMGPSGSGKSTLLYLLGGLDKPTSGTIKLFGKDISGMNDKEESKMRRQDVGFIFQFYNLIPNLSVEENIMLPIMLDKKNEKDFLDKFNKIIETVGLSKRRKHTPKELSGGEQQRVAIARALINDPGIILADEPTGNLDSKTGTYIMNLLKDINRSRTKTIIMVTHSNEASEFGDRIITMKDGRICNL